MNTEVIAQKALQLVQERKNTNRRLEVDAVHFAIENNISNTAAYDILQATVVLVGVMDAARNYSERAKK